MWKKSAFAFVFLLLSVRLGALIGDPEEHILRRGDADSSGSVNLTDAIYINNYLFRGGPAPPCMNQADTNDDGLVNSADSTYLTNWLFSGGPPPPSPGPFNDECASDGAPYPGCEVDPCP